MADRQSTKPARGTRDFLPDDVRRREYVIDVVRDVYERYGFEPIETPAFENIETLLGKYGEEGNQLVFKILKRGEQAATGEADLALRYDLTVPFARVIAEHQSELPTLFKRYQIQAVWRADRPARGRFREFYQCDIDAIGSTSPIIEVEILAAVSEILEKCGFFDFVIRLNHRRILAGLLESSGIEPARHADALTALDKIDKIGLDGVLSEMTVKGIDSESASEGLRLARERSLAVHRLALQGLRDAAWRTVSAPKEVLDQALNGLQAALKPSQPSPATLERALKGLRDAFKAPIHTPPDADLQRLVDKEAHLRAIDAIEEIVALSAGTAAAGRIVFDPSLARGLSYYTGAIMEIAVEGIGSLGGGGRYDNLVGMFLGRDVPACGFSLGLERIIVVMTEREMFPASVAKSAVDIVVTFLDEESRSEALKLAGELRQSRSRVDVYPDVTRKFDKPLKYASARGARVMAIFGENEVARGEVSIRNLETREQTAVPRADAVAAIGKLLK